MAEKLLKLRVVKDERSPTGYYIIAGSGYGVPANDFEVRLWNMYIEALDLAKRLRDELEEQTKKDDTMVGKSK